MIVLCFFFFKQKTAYEMRISDWSSDVCSSDLTRFRFGLRCAHPRARLIMSSIALEVARAHMSGRSFDHINDLLVNALRAHPDKVLLRTWEGGSFTGAEIETAVARYIAVLERHGVALGATVGLLAGNSVEVLFAQQAIGVKIGRAPV